MGKNRILSLPDGSEAHKKGNRSRARSDMASEQGGEHEPAESPDLLELSVFWVQNAITDKRP